MLREQSSTGTVCALTRLEQLLDRCFPPKVVLKVLNEDRFQINWHVKRLKVLVKACFAAQPSTDWV